MRICGNDRPPVAALRHRPIQFVDVFPNTSDRKVRSLSRPTSTRRRRRAVHYQPDPATERFPLALISPSSEQTISSTLGELPGADGKLLMHPADAAARGLEDNDAVRVFNELGEVHCTLQRAADHPSGHGEPAERAVATDHAQRSHRHGAGARHASDIGGGACFNDARVQVASLPTA